MVVSFERWVVFEKHVKRLGWLIVAHENGCSGI